MPKRDEMSGKNATGHTLPHISLPIVVEGRYDKSAILGMYSATVITTEGFGVFNSREKQKLIRRLGENGIIILTDSDGGGKQIRSFLSGMIERDKLIQLYTPRLEGKEKRKPRPSKEGVLGVEGVGADALRKILDPFVDGERRPRADWLTPIMMYELGLTGHPSSSVLRDAVALRLGLPRGMSAKAFVAAVGILSKEEELLSAVSCANAAL